MYKHKNLKDSIDQKYKELWKNKGIFILIFSFLKLAIIWFLVFIFGHSSPSNISNYTFLMLLFLFLFGIIVSNICFIMYPDIIKIYPIVQILILLMFLILIELIYNIYYINVSYNILYIELVILLCIFISIDIVLILYRMLVLWI